VAAAGTERSRTCSGLELSRMANSPTDPLDVEELGLVSVPYKLGTPA
jgi:hypothetical protein